MVDRRRVAIAIVILLVSVGVGYAATSSYILTEDVHLDANDGPEVILGEDFDLDAQQPFPDGNTVDISPHGELRSDGETEVRLDYVDDDEISLSQLEVDNNALESDFVDANYIEIEGGVDEIAYNTDIDESPADEIGDYDLRYSASDEFELTIGDLPTNMSLVAVDGDGDVVDDDVSDEDGYATFDLDAGDTDIIIEQAPEALTIRDETTGEIINDTEAEVEVRFFVGGEDQVITRSTTTGEIDLGGLPVTDEFIVDASAEGYEDRRIIIESVYEQSDIYLLDDEEDSVLITFDMDDRTEDFPSSDTKLYVEKPIGHGEESTYQVIAGDYFGAGGEYPVVLERGDRYRLTVENRDGQTRSLGAFVPETDDFITLEIGQITVSPGEDESWIIDARTIDDDGEDAAEIRFRDEIGATDKLEYKIVDRHNDSNVLHGPVEHSGPLSDHQETIPIPEDDDTNWVVEWEVERDGDTHNGTIPIGGVSALDWPVSSTWLSAFGLFAIVGTASLFGGSMSRTGAVVTAVAAWGLVLLGVLTIPYVALILASMTALVFKWAEQSDQGGFI